jgi:hypothetical protein
MALYGGRGGKLLKACSRTWDVVLINLSWGRGESDQLLTHGLLADWCPLPCTRRQMLAGCSQPLLAGSWLAAALMAAPGHSCPLLSDACAFHIVAFLRKLVAACFNCDCCCQDFLPLGTVM